MSDPIEQLEHAAWKSFLVRLRDAQGQDEASELIDQLTDILRRPREHPEYAKITGADGARLIEIGIRSKFPPYRTPYRSPNVSLLFWFVTMKHPAFVDAVEQHYEACDDNLRFYPLTILAAQGTEEAAEAMGRLVRAHGFPKHTAQRLFWELSRHVHYVPNLMPRMLTDTERHIADVTNLINQALEADLLSPADIETCADLIRTRVRELLGHVLPLQQADGIKWCFDEDYTEDAMKLGPWLDLLGHLSCEEALLEELGALQDPYLVVCTMGTLFKWDRVPNATQLDRVAREPTQRSNLFRVLKGADRLDLFPEQYMTFEAFAANDMARWIVDDTAEPPETLELKGVFAVASEESGEVVYSCLWRFEMDGDAYAGVSGAYDRDDLAAPLFGSDTFSNFAAWDSATPEEHLGGVAQTLGRWRRCR